MGAEIIGIKTGRVWSYDANGRISRLTRTYIVSRGDCPTVEELSWQGLPKVGDEHEQYADLIVSSVTVRERQDGGKNYADVEVTYSSEGSQFGEKNTTKLGQDIQSWGWTSGNVTRDLTNNIIDNSPITNSAGQPFASPITYEAAAPVFRKVFKTKSRRNWSGYVNRINFADVTIGGETFAACTVRVTRVDCEKLWDDPFGFAYQYTIEAQVMHNNVTIGASSNLVDIGWDIAVLDCGCYYLAGDKLKRITVINEETGEESPATTPQMLNGEGGKLTGDLPYNIRVRAYPTATFPADFWSDTPRYAREIN